MAKIYYKRIKAGIMTIDEVPTKWRKEVETMVANEKGGDMS